jgi:Zn-dependent M28 family amino/carboxypeptidase
MNLKPVYLFALILVFTIACTSEDKIKTALEVITEESIAEHVRVLADDSFMGRAPATEGERMTVEYIISQYEKIGLEPGMPDGSWIQMVPVIGQTTSRNTSLRISNGRNQLFEIPYFTDLMVSPALDQEKVNLRNAEFVFVGYGIDAPEENWNDYKDVDVSGKIIVVKNSNPMNGVDGFRGNSRLYYGRWSYKYEIAQEKGAIGILIIHTTPTAGYPWSVVANSFGRERFTLKPDGENRAQTEFNGWLSARASVQLFEAAGLNLEELMEAADSPDFQPVSLGNLRASIDLEASYKELEVMNVVGLLKGEHPQNARKDIFDQEYVVFSAHHDHLGIGTPVDGDSVYNGAMDNASGVSGMINLAHAFTKVQRDLKRNLLFVAVGAEESGLLGSQYFALNPPVPAGRMSANINTDMLNVYGVTRDVVSIGLGRTSIDSILEEEAARYGRHVVPDQQPDQGFFYRSDHFSFARVGVPALYLNRGVDFIDKPDNHIDFVAEHLRERYHAVQDRFDDTWDLAGTVEDLKLYFRVAYRIANDDKIMSWTPGNEFEAARLRSLEELN